MEEINSILVSLFGGIAGLAGLSALIAFVVQLAKDNKLVADGDAGKVSAALNLVAGAIVYFATQYVTGFDIASVDGVLGEIASVGVAVAALFAQVSGSKAFYLLGKWVGLFQSQAE